MAGAIGELTDKAKKIGLFNKPSLSDMELTAVAIAYNTGNFIPSKGLMQGHFDGHKFYGQQIFEFIRMAHTVRGAGRFADIAATAARQRHRAAPDAGRGDRAVPHCRHRSSARCACAASRRSVRRPPPT